MSKITFPFGASDLNSALGSISTQAGRYILGADHFWHGGIHLSTTEDTQAVLAPADGHIVAHRTMKARTQGPTGFEVGEAGEPSSTTADNASDISSSFVLTRHTHKTPKEQEINYYVLYMHLLCYDHYQPAHKMDPPPYLYRHKFVVKEDEDKGGSLIGNGLRLRSAPRDRERGIINNVVTVLAAGTEIRFVNRGEYKHNAPPSGKEAYLEVEVPDAKTIRVRSGFVSTGFDTQNALKLVPKDLDAETLEQVLYDPAHPQRYQTFIVNTPLENESGLTVYANTEGHRGKDPLIVLPYGTEITLLSPISLSQLQQKNMQPIEPVDHIQPERGYIYCGQRGDQHYIDKQNTEELVGVFDEIAVIDPPLPVHSGEVIGYPGDYQRSRHLHMELWLENIDFFDNPKGDKQLADSLTLPEGTPAKKATGVAGSVVTLGPEERLYEQEALANGVHKIDYGNPVQPYFVYSKDLSDYIDVDDDDYNGYYTPKRTDRELTLYRSNPSAGEAEAHPVTLAPGERLYLVRPTLAGGIRKVLYGNPAQVYFARKSELNFTPQNSYRPANSDGTITLYPSNPEAYSYSDSALPNFQLLSSLPEKKTLGDQRYYIVDIAESEDASAKTRYLVEEQEFDQHRVNDYDWKQFFLQKDLASLGLSPAGYYADEESIKEQVLEEFNQHIIYNRMQQPPANQSAHPLSHLMVKAGTEWSKSHKEAVNWSDAVVEHLWKQANITPEQEQAGITKAAIKAAFDQSIKAFSDKMAFYDSLKGRMAKLPDKGEIWHMHPLGFLGHLEKIAIPLLLTIEQLKKIAIFATEENVNRYIAPLNDTFLKFSINSNEKIAHFLAQVIHESGSLKYTKEGGVSDSAYGGFPGRGLIQLTFEANYEKFGLYVGQNFTSSLENKEKLESEPYAVLSAGWFWDQYKNLNQYAEKNDFIWITYLINGGFNGFKDRLRWFKQACAVLGANDAYLSFSNSNAYNNWKACFAWGLWQDSGSNKFKSEYMDVSNDAAKEGYNRFLFLTDGMNFPMGSRKYYNHKDPKKYVEERLKNL